MQDKGNSNLAERLLYEGKRQKARDKMYWKGSDINRYWITAWTERFCRPNFRTFVRHGEVVRLNEKVFDAHPKILLRQTADRIIATIDYAGVWFGRSIIALLLKPRSAYKVEHLLGVLNSKYFEHLYTNLTQEDGRVFAQVKLAKLKQLPIRAIDFTNKGDKAAHDSMVVKVSAMLEAKKQLSEAKMDKDTTYYENRCAALGRQIDRLVYELYGLTEKEIQAAEH